MARFMPCSVLRANAAWYASTESALDRWAARIRAWREDSEPIDAQRIAGRSSEAASRDVYCYFDKDIKVKAPFDARRLIDKQGWERGWCLLPGRI